MIDRVFCLALGMCFAFAAPLAAQERALRIEVTPCARDWLDEAELLRALRVELAGSDTRIDALSSESLRILRTCEQPTTLTLVLGERARTIDLADVSEPMRVRALALATRDLAVEEPAAPREPHPIDVAPIESPRSDDVGSDDVGSDDVEPDGHTPSAPEVHDAGLELSPPAAPDAVPGFGLSIAFAARAHLLGGRVPAPGLSAELAARVLGTPLSFWIALDGLYAFASDALGDVHAGSIDGRAGARLTLEFAPLEVSVAVGVLVGYAATRGTTARADVRALALDGALVGIDAAGALAYEVAPGTRLGFSVGVLGYALGFDARSEGRSVLAFRDVAPWLAVSVTLDLW